MCTFIVLGLVFPYQAKRLAWGTSPKWPILCRMERKTTPQSSMPLHSVVPDGRRNREFRWFNEPGLPSSWGSGAAKN